VKINRTWQGRLSASTSVAAKTAHIAIIVLAVLGGLNALWQALFAPQVNVVDPARTIVNQSAIVSSFAQDYVAVWLTATSSDAASLAQFVSVHPSDLNLPSTPAVVIGAPTVVAVTYQGGVGKDSGGEVYSVTVGVTERPYESASPTRAVYRVPVLWSRFGPRAVSLPYRVMGPGAGADLALAYPTTLAATDPAYATAAGFITAYLTAGSGVDRYVTADSRLVALGGVYQNVSVGTITATQDPPAVPADGQTSRVLAHITAVTSQYAPVQLVYPLTLRGVAGRWSIAAIDPAPALSDQDELVPVVISTTPAIPAK
jgi:hypothetical protein